MQLRAIFGRRRQEFIRHINVNRRPITVPICPNLRDEEILMDMSSIPFDEFMGIFLVAGIVCGENAVPAVEFDFWNVFGRNVDTVRPTVQFPLFAVAPIFAEVRNVAQFRVALVFVRLHVNDLLPYKYWFAVFLRKSDHSDGLGWRTVGSFWSGASSL